jgi:hypothetical protein
MLVPADIKPLTSSRGSKIFCLGSGIINFVI